MLDRNELARILQVSHSPCKFSQVNHTTCKFLQVNHLCKKLANSYKLTIFYEKLACSYKLTVQCRPGKIGYFNTSKNTKKVSVGIVDKEIEVDKHKQK